MGVLDSSYIKAMGVKLAGLKKFFLVFQDTLTFNILLLQDSESKNLDKVSASKVFF